MTKELARYFVTLIDRDLYFSFNGMGIPSGICEWLENQLMRENFDKVEEFIKKRYDEHENTSKKKRKFRAMTNNEFCKKWWQHHLYCESSNDGYRCPQFGSKTCCKINANEPYKINGKYILVEVKK